MADPSLQSLFQIIGPRKKKNVGPLKSVPQAAEPSWTQIMEGLVSGGQRGPKAKWVKAKEMKVTPWGRPPAEAIGPRLDSPSFPEKDIDPSVFELVRRGEGTPATRPFRYPFGLTSSDKYLNRPLQKLKRISEAARPWQDVDLSPEPIPDPLPAVEKARYRKGNGLNTSPPFFDDSRKIRDLRATARTELERLRDQGSKGLDKLYAPVDEVGGVSRANNAFGFSRVTKGGDSTIPVWNGEKPEGIAAEEALVKHVLAPFKDSKTNLIIDTERRATTGIFDALRGLDNPEAGRYEAVLRQMRGAPPDIVKELPKLMPKSSKAWVRSLGGKLSGTEAAIKFHEFSERENYAVKEYVAVNKAKEAVELTKRAMAEGDHVAASLAADAAFNYRGKARTPKMPDGSWGTAPFRVPTPDQRKWADHALETAKIQLGAPTQKDIIPAIDPEKPESIRRILGLPKSLEGETGVGRDVKGQTLETLLLRPAGAKAVPYGSKGWLDAFNPRYVEKTESRGMRVLPIGEAENELRGIGDTVEDQLERQGGIRTFTTVPENREPMPPSSRVEGASGKLGIGGEGMKGGSRFPNKEGVGFYTKRDWPKGDPDAGGLLRLAKTIEKQTENVSPDQAKASLSLLFNRGQAAAMAGAGEEVAAAHGAKMLEKLAKPSQLDMLVGLREAARGIKKGQAIEGFLGALGPEVGGIIKALLRRV